MLVNVAQLLKSYIGDERVYHIDENININGSPVRVNGDVKLIRTDRAILVRGDVKTEIKLECCRCLEPFFYPLDIEFEEEYFPTIDILSGLPAKMPEEETVGFTIDENHIINMDYAIREYAQLEIPMKPLCREDCAGLCAKCGKNLNKKICNCLPEIDPRLAKLKDLLKMENRRKN